MGLGAFKRVDFYRKVPVDLTEPTAPGAIISIIALTTMVVLFFAETRAFLNPHPRSDLFVAPDEEHGARLKVVFNMTFHRLPCFVCSLDVLDVIGRHEINVLRTTRRTRVRPDGEAIGQYNDASKDEEYREMSSEGCNIEGYVLVHKVPGNFHVSAHGLSHLVNKYLGGRINVEHTIHHLHFGDNDITTTEGDNILENSDGAGALPSTTPAPYDRNKLEFYKHKIEGEVAPLDGLSQRDETPMHYEYYIDIVPTIYTHRLRRRLGRTLNIEERGYQFTSNNHKLPNPPHHMAAVFFQYQLSPITVSYGYEKSSITSFLTNLCAIIGGVFTVAGIISRVVQASAAQVQRRIRGKDQ